MSLCLNKQNCNREHHTHMVYTAINLSLYCIPLYIHTIVFFIPFPSKTGTEDEAT